MAVRAVIEAGEAKEEWWGSEKRGGGQDEVGVIKFAIIIKIEKRQREEGEFVDVLGLVRDRES